MATNWWDPVKRWAAGVALVAIVVGGIGATAYVLLTSNDRADTLVATPQTTLTPVPYVPSTGEFTVGVSVSKQECPRPDTCVYTYTIDPRFIGVRPLPETERRVRYRVSGGYQPQDGDFTVDGREARFTKDVTVEGPPNARLTAAVTEVVERPVYGPGLNPPPANP